MVGGGNANKIHLVSMLAERSGVRSEKEREMKVEQENTEVSPAVFP
jgi:hypothetical protein